jgi:proteasome assembly chaperone (PAC2) family protein
VRPVVKFEDGYPESIHVQRNELFYVEQDQRGLLIFLGDEPQLDVERYSQAFLHVVKTLGVKRIVGFGGVYGELPYDRERLISSIYSLPHLKEELDDLAVNLSDYHGGASVGSYICRRAGEHGIEYVSFYAFVPAYDFSNVTNIANTIRIENDFMAWLGIMQRVNHMLKLNLDLSDLEQKSSNMVKVIDSKIAELEEEAPQLGVREYINRLSEEFKEAPFTPLDEVWEEELRRLFGQLDSKQGQDDESD